MKLTERALELNAELVKMKDISMRMISANCLKYGSPDEFMLVKELLRFVDDSAEFMMEHAQAIDEINEKLDLLLKNSK